MKRKGLEVRKRSDRESEGKREKFSKKIKRGGAYMIKRENLKWRSNWKRGKKRERKKT